MMQAFCLQMEGGCVHSNPRFFLRRTRPLQVSSCRELDVVFESGGLRPPPPPNPPLSFQAVQACFQEHGTIKKNCVRHMLASSFLPAKTEPIRACDKDLVFASGKGCASNTIVIQEFFKAQSTGYRPSACKRSPRGPCIFASCARSLQVSSYQPKQNPSGPVKRTLCLQSLQVSSCQQEQGFVIKTLCLQVSGAAPPPNPPAFLFKP